MTAVEVPAHLKLALTDYPACDARSYRPAQIVERCAKPAEWGMRCNKCGHVTLLCEEHEDRVSDLQRPQGCVACKRIGLIGVSWTFYRLRASS